MRSNKKRESEVVGKLSPAERLRIACELSDLCRDLGKAGEKALAKRLRVDKAG